MAVGDAYLEKADAVLVDLFSSWSITTTIIATLLFFYLAYPWLTWRDPDVHPFLLARQASAAPVRQPGESAAYRSIEIPYGYPLRAGLGVKDPGAPKWHSGRNGDLRDIWRQATRGPVKDDGSPDGAKAKLFTVLGRKKVVTHELDAVTCEINAIGKHIQEAGGKRVAICLSNSVELIASIFAASFYNYRPVLVPNGLSSELLTSLLLKVAPDFLIAEAGSVDLESTLTACPLLKHVIWVTKGDNEHMDWSEVPEGSGGKIEVSSWREIVRDRKASSDVLPVEKESSILPLSSFWQSGRDIFELVDYTSENLIAAAAALNAAGARNHRLGPSDLVLPTSPLTLTYPLCLTFAALFSYASVAFNSVAGEDVDLESAISGVTPTIIEVSTKTISDFNDKVASMSGGIINKYSKYTRKQTLQAGNMPIQKHQRFPGRLGDSLSKLRLLMIAHRAGATDSPTLSSSDLTSLRSSLSVRIAYALTASAVAGAVCQTNILDYRDRATSAHFGPPLSSHEICLIGQEDEMAKDNPQGKIVVRGPSVSGNEVTLDVVGQIGDDNTLTLA